MTVILDVISWCWQILCWSTSVHIRYFYNLCDISGLGFTIFFRPQPWPHSIWPHPVTLTLFWPRYMHGHYCLYIYRTLVCVCVCVRQWKTMVFVQVRSTVTLISVSARKHRYLLTRRCASTLARQKLALHRWMLVSYRCSVHTGVIRWYCVILKDT